MIDVNSQIEIINRSIEQIIAHPSEYDGSRFLELCELRRKLNKLAEAESEMPTIAAFGECQRGKSVAVGHLLNGQKNPFRIKDENGNLLDFWGNISPAGIGSVSASVLMRFSFFGQNDRTICYMPEHPIMLKLLGVADMAIILTQAYYSSSNDSMCYDEDEMKTIASQIFENYSNMPEYTQDILVEDDVIGIKNYLAKYVPSCYQTVYFEMLAKVIRRVPKSEWVSVMKYLWHENRHLTELFRRLVDAMQCLEFARIVYADFDAVLHLGDKKNTILCKESLDGLSDSSMSSATTNVYVLKNDKLETVSGFPKCYLSAICAEVVFKIEPEYLDYESSYFFDNNLCDNPGQMTLQTRMKLPDKVRKDLLVNTDLLDFPGVYSELMIPNDAIGHGYILSHVFLHSKIAYLFNIYNENHLINTLVFCHDGNSSGVGEMYRMINNWVENNVGNSAQIRKQTISCCGGISPLFVVGTKFHDDMVEVHWDGGDLDNALNQRWSHRFGKVLYRDCFNANIVDWFRNWDAAVSTFKNTYLLRDFEFSGCKWCELFSGYERSDSFPMETSLLLSSDFYNRLRETFIGNPDVQMFFDAPVLTWDVVATMNNNGALYLIEKLSVVAKNIGLVKEKLLVDESQQVQRQVEVIIKSFSEDIERVNMNIN